MKKTLKYLFFTIIIFNIGFLQTMSLFAQESEIEIKTTNPLVISILKKNKLEKRDYFSSSKWTLKTDENGRKTVTFTGYYIPEIYFALDEDLYYYSNYISYCEEITFNNLKANQNIDVDEYSQQLQESYFNIKFGRSRTIPKDSVWQMIRNGYDISGDYVLNLNNYFYRIKQDKNYKINLFAIEDALVATKQESSPAYKFFEILYNQGSEEFIAAYEIGLCDIYYIPNKAKSRATYTQDFQFTLNEKEFKELASNTTMDIYFNISGKSVNISLTRRQPFRFYYAK